MSAKRLLVIFGDDLNKIAGKGEIVERYFNPGDYFDEVELVAIQDDPVVHRPELLAPTAGRARLEITVLKRPSLLGSLGWHRRLLGGWLKDALGKIKARPDLIRVVGLRLNLLLGVEAKRAYGAPLVASVHEDGHQHRALEIEHSRGLREKIMRRLFARRMDQLARYALPHCDRVIGVYDCVLKYIRRLGYPDPDLIYNSVSDQIAPKTDYSLSSPARLLYTGNLLQGIKGPLQAIGALVGQDAVLDVVGDGPLKPEMIARAEELGVSGKLNFLGPRPNSWLAENLRTYDIYVYEFKIHGLSKSVIEAMLCGLPVVINRHPDYRENEFENAEHLLLVDESGEGYREVIKRLLADDTYREKLGKLAREYAGEHYAPAEMERRTVELYRSLVTR